MKICKIQSNDPLPDREGISDVHIFSDTKFFKLVTLCLSADDRRLPVHFSSLFQLLLVILRLNVDIFYTFSRNWSRNDNNVDDKSFVNGIGELKIRRNPILKMTFSLKGCFPEKAGTGFRAQTDPFHCLLCFWRNAHAFAMDLLDF